MDNCYNCGIELNPLSELSLEESIEMESHFRERFPNTWKEASETQNKVRVCDRCDTILDLMETPEQYEKRRMEEDDGQYSDRP